MPSEPFDGLCPDETDADYWRERCERIGKAFDARLAIYRDRHASANPLGDDLYNRWGATLYVIEAFELLAKEAGLVRDHITPAPDA